MNYQSASAHRVSGFCHIFAFGVLTLLFSLFLATISHAATAVGVTSGSFDVSNSGRATYTIPLTLPPGINGTQPSLSLRYRSGNGNGLLGVGWSLSGLSVIRRCDQTIAQNGKVHGVDYSDDDRLCLGGSQLRLVSTGSYWSDGAEYRTERERFARITQHGTGTGIWFEVETKSGKLLEYGRTTDSRINTASGSGFNATRVWAINKMADRNDNAVLYSYSEDTVQGSYRPSQIDYTDSLNAAPFYSIYFDYTDNRPDVLEGYAAGGKVWQHHRLSAIRIETTTDKPVRRYELAYQTAPITNQSRLISVTECAGTGWQHCFNPTTFAWGAGATAWASSTPMELDGHLLDMDGDGFKDRLYIENNQWMLRWGTGTGFSPAQSTGLFDDPDYYTPSKLVVDHNADGHQELLLPGSDNGIGYTDWYLFGYGTSGFYRINTSIPARVNDNTTKVVDVMRVVDINGDGRSDLIRAEDQKLRLYLGTDSGWDTQPLWNVGFPVIVAQQHPNVPTLPSIGMFEMMQIGDINADGLSDFIIGCLSTCPGGEPGPVKIMSSPNSDGVSSLEDYQIMESAYGRGALLVDINADGADDLLYATDNNWHIALSNGQQLMTGQAITSTDFSARPKAADYNGDGLMDVLLVTIRTESMGDQNDDGVVDGTYEFRGDKIYLLRSTGQTLLNAGEITDINLPRSETTHDKITLKDINNDGLKDIISTIRTTSSIYLHNIGQADVITAITDGFGTTWDIDYTRLNDRSVYTPVTNAISYPQQHYTGSRRVVADYQVDNGIGGHYRVSYRYTGARVNILGRGFLGFASREITDSRMDAVVTEQFKQSWPYTGITKQKDLRNTTNGKLLSRTTITPAKKMLGSGDQQRVFVYPKTTTEYSYRLDNGDLLKTVTTQLSDPDDYGNSDTITVTTTDKTINGDNQTFTTTKVVNYTNTVSDTIWCLGQPRATTITKNGPNGSHTQKTSAKFDVTHCRPTQQTLEALDLVYGDLSVTTAYQYDSWGNVKTTTVSAQGLTSRTAYADYNYYQGRFPRTLTNAAGHSSTLTWDTTLGLKTAVKDPNDLKTTFDYDAFGRLVETDRPDAVTITLERSWCGLNHCGVIGGEYKVTQKQTTGQLYPHLAIAVYDAFGRKVMTGSQGLKGTWTYQATHYNALGQVYSVSQPFQTGGKLGGSSGSNLQDPPSAAPSFDNDDTLSPDGRYWTLYAYDLLGRVVETQHSGSAPSIADNDTQTVYQGFKTTVTNPLGQSQTAIKNVIGQTIKVIDPAGNSTTYDYDAAGNLIETTDPELNTITMAYDVRGNKRTMTDPDMGYWQYTYNAYSELTQQVDAKGQTTKMSYDKLGRLVERIDGAGSATPVTSTWTYDTAAHGKGKLASVSNTDGYHKVISYDDLSRPIEEKVTIKGVDYVTTTGYDAYSRIDTITYPASVATDNNPVSAIAIGPDTPVVTGTPVTLSGSQSTGQDGLSYAWQQTGGPTTLTISDASTADITVTPTVPGTYPFTLTVTDGVDTDTDTTTVIVKPHAPDGLIVDNQAATSSDGSYLVEWQAPDAGLPAGSEYRLYESADPNFTPQHEIYTGIERSHPVSDKPTGRWNYRVQTCTGSLCSDYALPASIMVQREPDAPTELAIAPDFSPQGDITLTWEAPPQEVTDYQVIRADGITWQAAIEKKELFNQPAGILSYTVRARNMQYYSKPSASVSVTVPAKPGRPSMADPNHDGQFSVDWAPASGAVDYYQLQQARNSGFTQSVQTMNSGTQTATTASVSVSDTYYYRVRACYSQGCGRWSATRAITVQLKPGTPNGIGGTADESAGSDMSARMDISWGAASGGTVDHYALYWRQRDGMADTTWSGWSHLYNTSARNFTHYVGSGIYQYRVRACNNVGCSGYAISNAIEAVFSTGGGGGGSYKCPPLCGWGATQPENTATAYKVAAPAFAASSPSPLWGEGRGKGLLPDAEQPARAYKAGWQALFSEVEKASGYGTTYRLTVEYVYGDYGNLIKVQTQDQDTVYWQAQASDAYGHITQALYGNGITTQRAYDPATGRLAEITAGPGLPGSVTSDDILYRQYDWDAIGNLTGRTNLNQNLIQTFDYDPLNRLTGSDISVNGAVAGTVLTVDYNAIGNITTKNGVRGNHSYTYDESANAGPHAITSLTGTISTSYQYDANGNMTSGNNRSLTWNTANYPTMITQGNQRTEFTYGPNRQRYYQKNYANGSLTQTTITVNALFQEEIQGGTIRYQHFIRAAGKTIAIHTRTNQTDANGDYQHNTRYLHRDHLGSLVAISDATGTIVARLRYDAFGARVTNTGQSPATNPAPGIERGYTGHQMLDAVGLIHMNGRVYDPVIGRFLSADPLIQAPYNSQSYNRYSYVWNNPLSATDPSGFQMQFSYCRFCEPIPIMGGTLGMSIMASGDTYFCAYGGRAACSTNSRRMRQGRSFIPRGGNLVRDEVLRRGLNKEQKESLEKYSRVWINWEEYRTSYLSRSVIDDWFATRNGVDLFLHGNWGGSPMRFVNPTKGEMIGLRIAGNVVVTGFTLGASLAGRGGVALTVATASYLSTGVDFATAKDNTEKGLALTDASLHAWADVLTWYYPPANAAASLAVDVYMEALRANADD